MHATFTFAARHPEVMKFVPCFCGCQRGHGHKDNHDCFVSGRDAAGKVTTWEPHALECQICVDVAYEALQLHNSGASVAAIRDAIEKKYPHGENHQNHTPTPMPKARGRARLTNTFARLFDALHEGVYVGLIAPSGAATTIAANPHLRLIFGWPDGDRCVADVQPFDRRTVHRCGGAHRVPQAPDTGRAGAVLHAAAAARGRLRHVGGSDRARGSPQSGRRAIASKP